MPNQAAKLEIGLPVCEPCGQALRQEDIITDAGWADITAVFASIGKAAPDRASIEVSLKPIAGAKH